MQLSINIRNWGAQSTPDTLLECARAADESGLDTLWLNEHLAIPPQADMPDRVPQGFAEGRFLDPMATLSFLAAATRRIGLGTAVLLLPYRLPLQTAKLVATVQELSGGRLRLGVGTGWMKEEFQALGVDHARRGAISNSVLALLRECFENDVVESNGQRLLFRPRPARPPIYVGGAPPHALRRAVQYGDGWIPAGIEPQALASHIAELRQMSQDAGRPPLEVIAMKTLAIDDPPKAIDYASQFAEAGVNHLVHTQGYADAAEYRRNVATLEEKIRPAVA